MICVNKTACYAAWRHSEGIFPNFWYKICVPNKSKRLYMNGRSYICALGIVSIAMFSSSAAQAKEITHTYRNIELNANLMLAESKQLSDGVILITHGGLMHRDMELYVHLQKLLKEQGYSSLAINLSLGINNRHGVFDCATIQRHRYSDAADEIGSWVHWLKTQGAKEIVLLGHSRGGAETALYASTHHDPAVKAVILLAPDTRETNDAKAYQAHFHQQLAPVLAKAQKLVKQGKGEMIMNHANFLHCADSPVTATTFVSYYGHDPRLDTAYLIPDIKNDTLLVLAGSDQIVVNDKKFLPLSELKHVQVKTVEGAGHFFRDLFADDAVDDIKAFLNQIHAFAH